MNKKFLSAILFGALVATTGSFVSCNDDSSDVNGLQEQIDALSAQFNKQIATLQVELNAALDAAKTAQNAADQAVAEAKAQAMQEVMDQLEAYIANQGFATTAELADIQAQLNALGINQINATIDGISAEMQAMKDQIAALGLQNGVLSAYQNLVGQVGENAEAITSLQAQIALLTSLINNGTESADVKARLEALEAAIVGLNAGLNVLSGAQVGSIVFDPDMYMDGIEAEEYIYLVYEPFVPVAGSSDKYTAYDVDALTDGQVVDTNAKWNWENRVAGVGNTYIQTKVVNEAHYFVNPINANVALADLAMVGKDAAILTRQAASGISYAVDYADSQNLFKGEIVTLSNGKSIKRVQVPYTAEGAQKAGLLYEEYNMNTFYNALAKTAKFDLDHTAYYDLTNNRVVKDLNTLQIETLYQHDIEEGENAANNFDGGKVTVDEGVSNIFQMHAMVDDESSIASDYAMLYASPITPIAIAFAPDAAGNVSGHKVLASVTNDCACPTNDENLATKDGHLFRTMQEAIESAPSFEVAYYGDQVDLKNFLEIHVNRYSKVAAHSGKHVTVPYVTSNDYDKPGIDRYGLEWNYELVEWIHGSNIVDTWANQGRFANPELAKEGIIKPCKINADGTVNTVATTKADYAIIGKEPILKVTVTDKNNNNAVVLIGFVKFKIVEKQENLDMGIIKNLEHTIVCGNYTSPKSFNTVWNEYQYNVLQEAVQLSYVEFQSLYHLDVDANGNALQFLTVGGAAAQSKDAVNKHNNANTMGIVAELKNVPEVGDNDNGLQWQLSGCDLRDIYWNHAGEYTVYVRYVRNNDTHSTKDPIYVALHIKVNYTPTAAGTIENKLTNYWYNVDNNISTNVWATGADNYDGVRANVQKPTDNSDTKNFVYLAGSAWDGNAVQFLNGAKSPATAAKPYEYFFFHPANNNVCIAGKYYLKVRSTAVNTACACVADGKTCATNVCPGTVALGNTVESAIAAVSTYEANYFGKPSAGTLYQNDTIWVGTTANFNINTAEWLCVLDKATGVITYHWEAPDNTLAKQLLNLADHKVANDYILLGVYGLNSTCPEYVKPLENAVYPVHFIRPITAIANQDKEVLDAKDNGNYINVLDLIKGISDWREVEFLDQNIWYFAYYNIKSVKVDIENTTSNIDEQGDVFTKLTDKTGDIILLHLDAQDIATANVYANLNKVNDEIELPITYGAGWVESANQAALKTQLIQKFGYIYYDNNRGNVEDFDLIIPVQLTYDWGTLPTMYAKVHVKGTIAND